MGALGVFFFVGNLVADGVGVWDFLPIVAITGGLHAIEQVHRNQERGLQQGASGAARWEGTRR